MIHRTGCSISDQGSSRYIEVETILVFYQERFISSGKHMLFDGNDFIGHMILTDNGLSERGLVGFTVGEKLQLSDYVRSYTPPFQETCTSSFGFGLQQGEKLVFCEVVVADHLYQVWFDGVIVGKLDQNESFQWQQLQPELLPVDVLGEISSRIEQHYFTF